MCRCIFLLAAAACILPASLSRYAGADIQMEIKEGRDSEDTYYFVSDGKRRPNSFIDESGSLVGFEVDLVHAVCEMAWKKCFFILAKKDKCVFSDRNIDNGGEGLMSGWFHGCAGFDVTPDWGVNFDFTMPYLRPQKSGFFVAPGNPADVDLSNKDLSTKNIVKVSGDVSTTACLRRVGQLHGRGCCEVMEAPDAATAAQMVLNGTADVLFTSLGSEEREVCGALERLGGEVTCSHHGTAVMLAKGSRVPGWWDRAFRQLYTAGEYSRLCQRAEWMYGERPNCLPEPGDEGFTLPDEKPEEKGRLWKFVASGRIWPASYMNTEGVLEGFSVGFMQGVCRVAGERCVLMTAEVEECTVRREGHDLTFPGRGLQQGWFDGCPGYFNSYERAASWDFSASYLVSASTFRVVPGNPSGFDPTLHDLSQWTIVYLRTAITNRHCLHRVHKSAGKLIEVEDVLQAQQMVFNGTADAWFSKYHGYSALEALPHSLQCQIAPTAILLKKGSEVPAWFDPAFEKWYQSGEYNDFCDRMTVKYTGHHFPCLPRPSKLV